MLAPNNMKTDALKKKSGIIKRPRITEKATMLSMQNAYTFDIAPNATKKEIAKLIETLYKVKPTKIAVSYTPSKNVFSRGNFGVKGGGKKAVVYLKKGDKIEFV